MMRGMSTPEAQMEVIEFALKEAERTAAQLASVKKVLKPVMILEGVAAIVAITLLFVEGHRRTGGLILLAILASSVLTLPLSNKALRLDKELRRQLKEVKEREASLER